MPTVMLIEDDETMVSLLTTLLKMEGYSVHAPEYYKIEGLLKEVRKEQPEVVFVDVHLNEGSGLELVREIRLTPGIQHMRILMSSGLNMQQECIQAGADGFIQKPFMPDELIKLIRTTN